jgi:hypothetical protein
MKTFAAMSAQVITGVVRRPVLSSEIGIIDWPAS